MILVIWLAFLGQLSPDIGCIEMIALYGFRLE